VVFANAWMNNPTGFALDAQGRVVDADPWGAMFGPSTWPQVVHMLLAAYMVTGFTVASVYAIGMLKGGRDRYHRLGLLIPLTAAAVVTPVQIGVGDWIAVRVPDVRRERAPTARWLPGRPPRPASRRVLGCRPGDTGPAAPAADHARERGQQVGAQLVVRHDPGFDQVGAGANQHPQPEGGVGVDGQRGEPVAVGAQDVGEQEASKRSSLFPAVP
jgi:hypothetical protein